MSRKSQIVSAGLVASLAMYLTGCADDEPAPPVQTPPQCVIEQNGETVIVNEDQCDDDDSNGGGFWYFGGAGGHYPGERVHGGIRGKRTDAHKGSVSRGGIGESTNGSGKASASS